jgi:uncharacterized protein (DUF849 family)
MTPMSAATPNDMTNTPKPGDLLITVAPTGAETSKADCPQLPTTLTELVETAQRCEQAGAAMIHVHIRDDEHRPTLDLPRLTETVDALHESTTLVVLSPPVGPCTTRSRTASRCSTRSPTRAA